MKVIEKKIRDVKSIRLLVVFDIVIIMIVSFSFFYLGFFSPVTYIFLPILLICISLQFLLYLIPKGKILFDSNGITIQTRNFNQEIGWDKVSYIYFNSFSEIFPCLNHFTLDLGLIIKNKIVHFNNNFGDIVIYKKEYLNIISLIPRKILADNDFMVYINIVEKEKNKYNI